MRGVALAIMIGGALNFANCAHEAWQVSEFDVQNARTAMEWSTPP